MAEESPDLNDAPPIETTNPAQDAARFVKALRPRTLAIIGAVVIIAAGLIVWQVARPKPFDMHGSITMYDRTATTDDNAFAIVDPEGDATCHGLGGYSDMALGAQVTVYNSHGEIVAAGQIDSTFGMPPASLAGKLDAGFCDLSWTATGVPGGQGPYQYEVSHRGRMTVSEGEARAAALTASLGD